MNYVAVVRFAHVEVLYKLLLLVPRKTLYQIMLC